MMPKNEKLENLTVEKGLVFGLLAAAIGVVMIAAIVVRWWQSDFGELKYPVTMRWVVPGVTLVAIGFSNGHGKSDGGCAENATLTQG